MVFSVVGRDEAPFGRDLSEWRWGDFEVAVNLIPSRMHKCLIPPHLGQW